MTTSNPAGVSSLHRIEVWPKAGRDDPRAQAAARRVTEAGLGSPELRAAKVFLIQASLDAQGLAQVASQLLVDPLVERGVIGAAPSQAPGSTVEVHPLPGVMDPAAQSVQQAMRAIFGIESEVSTGFRYDFVGVSHDAAKIAATTALANPAIHQIIEGAFLPKELPRGRPYALKLQTVPLRDLNEAQLLRLSRDAHLFLSLGEMQAVQAHFAQAGREPTDIELETLAQTWSEHCVHKTLKSDVTYQTLGDAEDPIDWSNRPGHRVNESGTVSIQNLLKSTVAAATFELIEEGIDWALSVFKDNSGVVALDDDWAVNVKVETHNRPSAIEPYGGAATGIGGCIRDIIGTGLGAKPIANTDVFCVAPPDAFGGTRPLPPGSLHPRRILTEVVAGVRDYGNRMGIPTISGAVYFDERHVGNPLVFAGCVGLLPRNLIRGAARPGDRIVALGGRTGRDGIHGATFSSAELESNASTEFAHAVQIGNAIEEKRLMDAILAARDFEGGPLMNAITDCGAGGFSSAIGEMGADLGAHVTLEKAPLKYEGLSYTEIWISEAQERMVLAVSAEKLPLLESICRDEGVEWCDLGTFGTPNQELILSYEGTTVGRMPMALLHDGIPMPTRLAHWEPKGPVQESSAKPPETSDALLALLAHPNIASKHWIIRQYDHEVQGNTVVKPLCGLGGRGPSDASVIQPIPDRPTGIALGCGLQTRIGDPKIGGDTYQMVLSAIDECVRNLVCTGADPTRIAILDNFCWPSCERPENMGMLVRAAAGCYDGAKAYCTPFVSGKDSLNNQLRYTDPVTGKAVVVEIPPTLLITGLGRVTNVARCVTMDAKSAGNTLLLVGRTSEKMGGSHYAQRWNIPEDQREMPSVDLKLGPLTAKAVAQCIADGLVQSAHDVSDGGLLVSIAEMLIATTASGQSRDAAGAHSPLGALLNRSESLPGLGASLTLNPEMYDTHQLAFGESPSRYVLEVRKEDVGRVRDVLRDYGAISSQVVGTLNASGQLDWSRADVDLSVADLTRAWMGTLDW